MTDINKIIKADLYRYGGLTSILRGFRKEGFQYRFFFRKASNYKKFSPLGFFYGLIIRRLSHKYGFQIPVNTQIGEGFYIGHFGTIVINSEVTIGYNCNIAHSTTIGQVSSGKLKGCPNIGDYVWIGTGSVIVGNINIGSNVFIAPNTFVSMDVPDNSIVIGNPAKIIERKNATEGSINFILKN